MEIRAGRLAPLRRWNCIFESKCRGEGLRSLDLARLFLGGQSGSRSVQRRLGGWPVTSGGRQVFRTRGQESEGDGCHCQQSRKDHGDGGGWKAPWTHLPVLPVRGFSSRKEKKKVKTAHLCARFLPTAAAAEVGLGHFLLLLSAGPPSPRRGL